ncbi:DeoR/GlpR family DNA-binding transcription regulator [Demequina muriae]|uniref:DeoR/GlpR family DNA-binding transcription regulator n=1 Tax=Demequina muriae TaxID=3051664 RepID=A0ABT8GE97_9MICO|nr:DeoR/GlpR family DNA-binding transcription regulator [Demequina sp. EGI L300058]MDN4479752.1 DeoR/GlpR family DNA-binding transcription regulator [Demequina sp. EGI L300058]
MTRADSAHRPRTDAGRRLPAGRKADLVDAITDAGQVTVAELAEKFAVSPDTIRRDLDRLDADGLVIRTHGGAVSPQSGAKPETALDLRKQVQMAAKETIGELAAGLVDDGDTIMINGGTTALALARHLADHRSLTIATNNLLLSTEIDPECIRNLYVFGGTVRTHDHVSIGPVHLGGLAGGVDLDVRCRLSLIAVGGVNTASFSTSNVAEATMMRDMMEAGDTVAVMIDSSKFNRKLFAQFAPLAMADYVITDQMPGTEYMNAFAAAGVEVICPE